MSNLIKQTEMKYDRLEIREEENKIFSLLFSFFKKKRRFLRTVSLILNLAFVKNIIYLIPCYSVTENYVVSSEISIL